MTLQICRVIFLLMGFKSDYLVILKNNIYTTVSISFLFEWYDGVFRMKIHGIR
jgi:hypothetical protein